VHGVDPLVEGFLPDLLIAAPDQRQRFVGSCLLGGDRDIGNGLERLGGGDFGAPTGRRGDRQRNCHPHHHDKDTERANDQTWIDSAPGAPGQPAMGERAEHHSRQQDQDHRGRDLGRGGGLGVHPRGGRLVELRRVRQDRRLHQTRRLGQVGRSDRVAFPVVGARDLDQPGIDAQFGIDLASNCTSGSSVSPLDAWSRPPQRR